MASEVERPCFTRVARLGPALVAERSANGSAERKLRGEAPLEIVAGGEGASESASAHLSTPG